MKHYIWGVLFVCALLLWILLGIYFRLDRLYGDSANYLFCCINYLEFLIPHNRPVSVFVQVAPLMLAKFSADMETLITALSLNESLYTAIAVLLPWIIWRDLKLSIACIIPLFLGVKWNYFNPVSELILSAPLFILAFGMLLRSDRLLYAILFAFMEVFLLYCHPLYLILIPAVYVIVILSGRKNIRYILLHALVYGLATFLIISNADSYDKSQAKGSDINFLEQLKPFVTKDGINMILQSYAGLTIVALIVLIKIIREKSLLFFGYSLIVLIGWIFLVLSKYGYLFPDTFEPFERYLFPLAIIVGVLFYCVDLMKVSFLPYLLLFILIINTKFIFSYGCDVRLRRVQLENVIENAQNNNYSKIIVRYHNFYPQPLGHNWIMSSESLLLSGITGNKRTVQVSVYESFDQDLMKNITSDQYVHFPWYAYDEMELNPAYFYMYRQPFRNFNSDVSEHQYLNQEFFNKVKIKIDSSETWTLYSQFYNALVINNNLELLPSGFGNSIIYIKFAWIKNGITISETEPTALLCDIHKSAKQLVKFQIPEAREEMELYCSFLAGSNVYPVKAELSLIK